MAPIPGCRHRNSVHGKEVGKTLGALAGAPILVLFLVWAEEHTSQTGGARIRSQEKRRTS
jgi:hypothetical protein